MVAAAVHNYTSMSAVGLWRLHNVTYQRAPVVDEATQLSEATV